MLKTTTGTAAATGTPTEAGVREQGGGSQVAEFTALFGSTRRGARLARRVAVRHLADWGHPADSDLSSTVALLVAELAGNAVRHGHVSGRDFLLRVRADGRCGRVRVEVSDASDELPPVTATTPADDEVSGRGLLLIDALADRWGAEKRDPVGKTVWAEVGTGGGGIAR
ncbi:ATP-binding protein [Streptomyces sp. NPDC005805]|uniref:ATP-binding protein n=1 Tax=Streptomyces sp. NPDC005805 TaxID=3157068 RepID=UPI0033C8621F